MTGERRHVPEISAVRSFSCGDTFAIGVEANRTLSNSIFWSKGFSTS